MGFEVAFDDQVSFPVSGAVIGEHVQVLSVGRGDGRRELVATCERESRRYHVERASLLKMRPVGR